MSKEYYNNNNNNNKMKPFLRWFSFLLHLHLVIITVAPPVAGPVEVLFGRNCTRTPRSGPFTPRCIGHHPERVPSPRDSCGPAPLPTPSSYILSYTLGETVQYRCLDNTTHAGGSEILRCVDNMWHGRPLQCRRLATCVDLVSITNGVRVLTGTQEGDVVAFRCNRNYGLLGSRQLQCNSAGNWGLSWPQCRRDLSQCGDPGLSQKGTRTVNGTREGATVDYSCIEGYQLIGEARRTCLSNGEWSGSLPICQRIMCADPAVIAYGSLNFSSVSFGSMATYSCDFGYFMSGSSTSFCRDGAEWSHAPPSCTAVWCPLVSDPANGRVIYTHRTSMFGAEISYVCRSGYGLIGVANQICQANGKWSDCPPSCRVGSCEMLSDPANGHVIFTGMLLGGHAIFSCDSGYNLVGTTVRVCDVSGSWTLDTPTCESINCPMLYAPRNGVMSTTRSNQFLSVATYSCNGGYKIHGSVTRQCQATGRWNGSIPGCFGIRCGVLVNPHHGSVRYPSRVIGSEALYDCDPGYQMMFGDGIRECLATQQWSGQPPCCIQNEIVCPDLAPPINGAVGYTTRVGDEARYSCDSNFQLFGTDRRVCQANGTWTGQKPSCFLPCPILMDLQNGTLQQNGTKPGSSACYSCDEGFIVQGCMPTEINCNICRSCGLSGEWSGIELRCELAVLGPTDCLGLPDPDNGRVDLSEGTMTGARANYSCNERFDLAGQSTRTCDPDGKWTGTAPKCSLSAITSPQVGVIDCGTLSAPVNGVIELGDGTEEGAIAKYGCDVGYLLNGSSVRECLMSGQWSSEQPSCQLIDCGILANPANGTVDLSNGTVFGSIAFYSCSSLDFFILTTSNRTCQDDGMWSGDEPACDARRCEELSTPANTLITFTNANLVNSAAEYRCVNDSFRLVGNTTTRVCTPGGWTGSSPLCLAITCPALSDPTGGGSVEIRGSMPGDMAVYTCNNMFTLIGLSSRVCGSDGEWSGVAPVCIVIICPELPDPANGIVTVMMRTVNSRAIYSCNAQFGVSGSRVRTCRENGNWDGEEPMCIFVPSIVCSDLEAPIDGSLFVTSNNLDGIAQYSCDTGFRLVGSSVRLCQVSEEWSGTSPTCERNPDTVTCPLLSAPENGGITITSTSVGTQVTFTCIMGYMLEGSAERECQGNGMWSGFQAICSPVDCGALDNPLNGVVETPQGTILSNLAIYSCNINFVTDDISIRICQENGEWSGVPPTCRLVRCPVLLNPDNGFVGTSNANMVGSVATYGCNTGFSGALPIRVCMSNGQWSGSDPQCIAIQLSPVIKFRCPLLAAPSNGDVSFLKYGDVPVTIFECLSGFKISGSKMLTCKEEGKWNHAPPICTKISCADPGLPINGRRLVPGGFGMGERVFFIPQDGYEAPHGQESLVLMCGEDGIWDGLTPQFTPVEDSACSPGVNKTMDTFGRVCTCNYKNNNCCRYRQDWSSLTPAQKHRYIAAVLEVSSNSTYKPLYQELLKRYRSSFSTLAQSTDSGSSQFLHWHRYFLLEYEDLLRLVHRDITIPYWDWSARQEPYSANVFDPDFGFGDSSDPITGCVTSGPFREGEFNIWPFASSFSSSSSSSFSAFSPSDNKSCLTRDYGDFVFPSINILKQLLSLDSNMFTIFHNSVQLFLGLNIRCFVGGKMCTTDAASDPLFLLHLSRLDYFVQHWQDQNPNNTITRPEHGSPSAILVHTLDNTLLLSNFSRSDHLAYSSCVKYAPPWATGETGETAESTTETSGLLSSLLEDGEEGSRISLMSLCIPENTVEPSGLVLSEQIRKFLSRICELMTE